MDTNPRFSLHLIRGFWAAARHLSFTRAAAELFVTQSAVSREIKKLEEQLGQPLFHRVNRTLQLTQAGEDLYRAVDEALVLIDAAARRLAKSEPDPGRDHHDSPCVTLARTPAAAFHTTSPRYRCADRGE